MVGKVISIGELSNAVLALLVARSTPSPTATTVPLTSRHSLYGNLDGDMKWKAPLASLRSPGLSDAALQRMRTSVGLASVGTGTGATWKLDGVVYLVMCRERIVWGRAAGACAAIVLVDRLEDVEDWVLELDLLNGASPSACRKLGSVYLMLEVQPKAFLYAHNQILII